MRGPGRGPQDAQGRAEAARAARRRADPPAAAARPAAGRPAGGHAADDRRLAALGEPDAPGGARAVARRPDHFAPRADARGAARGRHAVVLRAGPAGARAGHVRQLFRLRRSQLEAHLPRAAPVLERHARGQERGAGRPDEIFQDARRAETGGLLVGPDHGSGDEGTGHPGV